MTGDSGKRTSSHLRQVIGRVRGGGASLAGRLCSGVRAVGRSAQSLPSRAIGGISGAALRCGRTCRGAAGARAGAALSVARKVLTAPTGALRRAARSLRPGTAQGRARAPARSKPERVRDIERGGGGSDHERTFQARSYPRSRTRHYLVHLPPGYNARRPLPLVMVLHGCRQRHRDIQHISDFDTLADRRGFAVVYPFVTSYSGWRMENCWGWWLRGEVRPGAGEVQDLWGIVEDVGKEFTVDPRRIHVTGLSSGAGMAVAMMVAHPDRIASGASVAGVPYSETAAAVGLTKRTNGVFKPVHEVSSAMRAAMGAHRRPVPIFIVHSRRDTTVDIQAAHSLRDTWAHCFGVDASAPASVRVGRTQSTAWTLSKYRGAERRTLIETLFTEDGEHGWLGGNPGSFSNPHGPNISQMMWRFFRTHPLQRSAYRQTTAAA